MVSHHLTAARRAADMADAALSEPAQAGQGRHFARQAAEHLRVLTEVLRLVLLAEQNATTKEGR